MPYILINFSKYYTVIEAEIKLYDYVFVIRFDNNPDNN